MVSFHEVSPGDARQAEQAQQASTAQEPGYTPNVAQTERILMGIGGGLLALRAANRPSLPNLLLGAFGGALVYWATTGHCPVYERLGINTARRAAARPHDYYKDGIHVEMAYTIDRPAPELYHFWHNFENLPRFMDHLKEVRKIDEKRSHWVAHAPGGGSVEWDAQIINDEPNRLIAWRSLENAGVDNAGSIWFVEAPGGCSTQVRISIHYIPPGGRLGAAMAWLFGEAPKQQIEKDLRSFKQLMENAV